MATYLIHMADPNTLSFKGTSPEECEEFVATIRRRAFDQLQGKHRDNEWMAGLASTYFVGNAFYGYEELNEDVQNDWHRLRPALLARFGRGGLTSTMTLSASTPISAPFFTIPTPAAAPPTVVPHPSVRKGHLKVLSSDGSLQGYLANRPSYTELSRNPSNALLIPFHVSSPGEAFEIRITNASQHPQTSDTLAITWSQLSGDKWMDNIFYTAWACSFLTLTSKRDWSIERKVWKISTVGELTVEYPKPDGGTETLYCSVGPGFLFRRFIPAESERRRIIFEDVV